MTPALHDFLTALALTAVIEGVLYALFPGMMARGAALILRSPENALRATGVALAVIGVAAVWLIRG